ncbi:MAG: DNA-binding protein [Clostridia bacterium]|nr:DNA-binding protein [Clostridia bacterium]
MEYKKLDNHIIVRLDPNDEICKSLLLVCEKENILLGTITGLGAVNKFTVGVFDITKKQYFANNFEGTFEIVSLIGNITQKDNKPYLHIHFSAGNEKGQVYGGHLNNAVISATAEIFINIISSQTISRTFDNNIGLNLLKF